MAGLMVAVGPEDVAKVIIEGRPIWYRPSCSPVCVVELVPEMGRYPALVGRRLGPALIWSEANGFIRWAYLNLWLSVGALLSCAPVFGRQQLNVLAVVERGVPGAGRGARRHDLRACRHIARFRKRALDGLVLGWLSQGAGDRVIVAGGLGVLHRGCSRVAAEKKPRGTIFESPP